MGEKSDFSIAVILLILMIPLFFFMIHNIDWTTGGPEDPDQNKKQEQGADQNDDKREENKDDEKDSGDKKNKDKDVDEEKDKDKENGKADENKKKREVVWGVDSASVTTEEVYVCVNDQFGKPEIWGRYLGSKEGVSRGITKKEVQYLHDREIKILPIYNHFTKAEGHDRGVELAQHAVSLAQEIGLPEDKAIFADIEPDYPVDASFIQGWYDGLKDTAYQPGIYGVFAEDQALFEIYNQVLKDNEELGKEMIIWSAHPQLEITTKDNAPKYEPIAPKNSLLLGWQYGIDAKECHIDTNLFKAEIIEYLW